MARNIGARPNRDSERKESISCMFLRHSAENIVSHAACRRIAPDTFPLLECADLPGSGIRRTDAVRAPRRYAPWARSSLPRSFPPHRPRTKERFHNSGRATHSGDRIGCHHRAQSGKQAGSPAIREGGLFPCQLEQFPSELNWTPRTAFTCLRRRRRQIALMAADTCNGAEGGQKAPPPPASLISPYSKVMPISPIWVDGIITKTRGDNGTYILVTGDIIISRHPVVVTF